MDKLTKILIWMVALILLAYFLFVPFEITRKKPEKISPQENLLPVSY